MGRAHFRVRSKNVTVDSHQTTLRLQKPFVLHVDCIVLRLPMPLFHSCRSVAGKCCGVGVE